MSKVSFSFFKRGEKLSTKTISSRCSFICIFFLLFFGFNISSVYSQDLNARQVSTDSRRMIVLKRRLEQERAKSVTNHKMFKVLQNHRGSEFELTKKCSQCHTNVSNHIHQVAIWNDDSSLNPDLSVSNVKSQCLSCHKEYSSNKDDVRAFTKNSTLSNFACMGCHSVSNDLKHGDFGPKKDNCGTCHFLNNSSNLDISLLAPDRNLDVHMSKSGGDFSCQVCHRNLKHNRGYKEGHKYFKKFMDIKLNRVGAWIEELNEKCSSCHTSSPHLNNPKLNDHTDVIGCQTCHIPYVGRSKHGTILKVDWSNKENGSFGAKTLRGQNIVPDYFWHKGVFISRKFNKVIDVNNSEKGQISFLSPDGKYKRDRGSKILPFLKRVFIVAQDVKHPNLLYPKISVNDKKWDMDM